MVYDGGKFSLDLLASRSIQRLCVDEFGQVATLLWVLQVTIWLNHRDLTYLLVPDVSLLRLADYGKGQGPYRNLKFLGTILFFIDRPAYDNQMEGLQSLDALESIDLTLKSRQGCYRAGSYPSDFLFRPESSFLQIIEEQHPLLRRILVSTRHVQSGTLPKGALLWEKRAEGWTSREVPYLRYWDILLDKLDEV